VLREKCGQQTKKFENFQTRPSSGVAGRLLFLTRLKREESAFIIILLKRAR
jgi:hypothetical protein